LFSFLIPEPGFSKEEDPTNGMRIDWRHNNWGSKWDVGEASVDVIDGVLTASYDSAWSPHCEGYKRVGQLFPDARITLHYYEGGAGFRGWMVIQGDDVSEECEELY